MRVWTRAYRPFIMGGNPHAPICCELEPEGTVHSLGKGIQVVLVVSPNGKSAVVEVQSGGVVGTSLELVRQDVSEADSEVMQEQIAQSIETAKIAVAVEAEEFWRHI